MLILAFVAAAPQQHLLTERSAARVFDDATLQLNLKADYSMPAGPYNLTAVLSGNGHRISCTGTCFDTIKDTYVVNIEFAASKVATKVVDTMFFNVTIDALLADTVSGALFSFVTYNQKIANSIATSQWYNTSFYVFPVCHSTSGSFKVISARFVGQFSGFCEDMTQCEATTLQNSMIKMEAVEGGTQTLLFKNVGEFDSTDVYSHGQLGPLFDSVGSISGSTFEIVYSDAKMKIAKQALSLKKTSVLVYDVLISDENGLFAGNELVLENTRLIVYRVTLDGAKASGLFAGLVSLQLKYAYLLVKYYDAKNFADTVCFLAPGAMLQAFYSHINLTDVQISRRDCATASISLLLRNQGDKDQVALHQVLLEARNVQAQTEIGSMSLLGDNLGYANLSSVQVHILAVSVAKVGEISLSAQGPSYFDGQSTFISLQIFALSAGSLFSGFGAIGSLNQIVIEVVLPQEFSEENQILVPRTASGSSVYFSVSSAAKFDTDYGLIYYIVVSFVGVNDTPCHICQENSYYPSGYETFTLASDAPERLFYSKIDYTCAEGQPPCGLPSSKTYCAGYGCAKEFIRYGGACSEQFTCIPSFTLTDNLYNFYDRLSICEFGYLLAAGVCSKDCAAFSVETDKGTLVCADFQESEELYNALCREKTCGCLSGSDVYDQDRMVCTVDCPGLAADDGVCTAKGQSSCYFNKISAQGDYKCDYNYCDQFSDAQLCSGFAGDTPQGEYYCYTLDKQRKCFSADVNEACYKCQQHGRGECVLPDGKQSYEVLPTDLQCNCVSQAYQGYFCQTYHCASDTGAKCGSLGSCVSDACECQVDAFLTSDGTCQKGCEGAIIFYGTCAGVNRVQCYQAQTADLDLVAVNCGDCRRAASGACGRGTCSAETGACECDEGYYLGARGVCVQNPECGLGSVSYDKDRFVAECRCGGLQTKKDGKCVKNNGAFAGIIVAVVIVVAAALGAAAAYFVCKRRRAVLADSRQRECALKDVYFYHAEGQGSPDS